LWAQWRSTRNLLTRGGKGGMLVTVFTYVLWYSSWAAAAAGAYLLTSGAVPLAILHRILPSGLFFVCFFWQMFPLMLASQGAYLDLPRLLVYPIPQRQLFLLEVALRISTGLEMLLVAAGLAAGLAANPGIPALAPLFIAILVVFNLFLSSGIKSLSGWLMRRRGARELIMLVFIAVLIVPQLFVAGIESGSFERFRHVRDFVTAAAYFPWTAAGHAALGRAGAGFPAALLAWTLAVYAFARWQFARILRLEDQSGAPQTSPTSPVRTSSWIDNFSRWPSQLVRDPLAALIERDIRILLRSPRFRLIAMMASCFGCLLWLPMALRGESNWIRQNYLVMACLYANLLIGEVLYWNAFGFELSAAQHWFSSPVPFRVVLRAKNAAAIFLTFCILSVTLGLSLLLPVPIGMRQIADAVAASLAFLIPMLAFGNLTSIYMPRPVRSQEAWKSSTGKTQFALLFLMPLLSIPILLAFLARWATGNLWAYFVVLGVVLVVEILFYIVATETAVEAAGERKELFLETLARKEGPISLAG
jgi:ABC-2 type transport system permease protein